MQLNAMEDFRREVSYHVLLQEDGTILLTATMNDRYHDILLEVTVDAESLTIGSATADFRKSPSRNCPDAAVGLGSLAGVVIGRGLFRRVRELLAGTQGCSNIRSMLVGLLPLAMNVKAAAGISDERQALALIHNRLIGTCAGYAKPLPRNQEGVATGH